ncbi:hypothetical protein BDV95DRAFT_597352 [Massariosphaeria phaeospora]|uniref:Urease accessory protein UreF n=1 Tax=Massariosphaeria phaeospora TaxID=100035 RepID=A0A7C8M5S4_9PLEO|nr:hypothetical protein BDV95DRAFT_597352 [Massariosphaeria phaeospora]
MSPNVLSARDTNVQVKPAASPEKEKPKTLEYHRKALESRLKGDEQQQYVSPSDEIMSPATQKLKAFRNKHGMKKSKPQTLFKKTSSKNFESAKGAAIPGLELLEWSWLHRSLGYDYDRDDLVAVRILQYHYSDDDNQINLPPRTSSVPLERYLVEIARQARTPIRQLRVFCNNQDFMSADDQQPLKDEIADLERRLHDAKARLNRSSPIAQATLPQHDAGPLAYLSSSNSANSITALHALLLLADSALPLGSFAFSSGLESYLAHHRPSPPSASQLPSFRTFLRLSLSTFASTSLPYVLAGYRNPDDIETLDNDFDASTPCTVARRASVAQGRALLTVWDRSFKMQYSPSAATAGSDDAVENAGRNTAIDALAAFSASLRTSNDLNAHLAPLWGLVTRILTVPLHDAAYLFLFSHARTVVSAAVRASVMGPYQAQTVLASEELQSRIRGLVDEGWDKEVEDAGQSVPVMDLWVGRHEKLYSRIFNS